MQVKFSKISYIGTLFKVQFIQDSGLFGVLFIQDSILFGVLFRQVSLLIFKSPKRCLETYCFCSVSSYYYYSYSSPFFLCDMNVSTADLRNYWTEFHETWWSYRYMFLVGPTVFSFVVKGVKVIF